MKITQITYARLESLECYANQKIELTATVDDHDSVHEVILSLKNTWYEHSNQKKVDEERKKYKYESSLRILRKQDRECITDIQDAYLFVANYEGISLEAAKVKYPFSQELVTLVSSNALPVAFAETANDELPI